MTRTKWSAEEENCLINSIVAIGPKWALIAKSHVDVFTAHPKPSQLKDHARYLKKKYLLDGVPLPHNFQGISDLSENNQREATPPSERNSWTEKEKESLRNAYAIFGSQWKKIAQFEKVELKRHSSSEFRNEILKMQKNEMKQYGKIIDINIQQPVPSYESVVLGTGIRCPTLLFTCFCGKAHSNRSLLLDGLQCRCNRNLEQMLLQIYQQISSFSYIITNNYFLSEHVYHVGYCNMSQNKMDILHHQQASFETLRIVTDTVSQYALTHILKPEIQCDTLNRRCRFATCDTHFDELLTQKILEPSLDNTTAGLIFSQTPCRISLILNFCYKNNSGNCKCPVKCNAKRMATALKFPLCKDKPITTNKKKSSLLLYQNVIDKLQRKLNLADPYLFFHYNANFSVSQQRTNVSAVQFYLSQSKCRDALTLLDYRAIQMYVYNKPLPKEQTKSYKEIINWSNISEITKALDQMEKDSEDNLSLKPIVVWYRMEIDQSAARNEYSTLKINNYDNNIDNYINIASKKIVLNEYKTNHAYSRQEFTIKDKVWPYIHAQIERQSQLNADFLFTDNKNQPYSSSSFSQKMMSKLSPYLNGKRIGSRQLRLIVASEYRQGEKSLQEKSEFSRGMLHGVGMNERYRRF